jgi:hypothetical protein
LEGILGNKKKWEEIEGVRVIRDKRRKLVLMNLKFFI